ncbi:MAG: hypothetical protein B7Z69_08715 [Actinobacteria bacterium 21-73-9]|nr:MAG: hypothetical protein B7Z69_08715 [Actinobacteria bacterium 21-73-9]
MTSVAVVGDVVLDVVVRVRAPLAATSDTPAEIVVGRGGSAANLAVALADAGRTVTFVGPAGRDDASRLVEDDLARHGVRAHLLRSGATTGTVVSLVDEHGQRAMLTDRGANGALSADAVVAALPDDATHLHVSGYTVLDERTRDAASSLLDWARRAGWSTSVDVCSVAPLRAIGRAAFAAATRSASMLFANAEEAAALSGCDDPDGALEALAGAYGEVLVTRGAEGAESARGHERARAAARAATVVDTTGAGDAASGAYLAARLAGDALVDALEAAMAAAARVVAGLGAVPYSRE